MTEDGFSVMAYKPFWRYCVVLDGFPGSMPAIPFYTHTGALEFARAMAASGSMFHTLLIFRKARFRWRQVHFDPVATFDPIEQP